MLQVYEEDYSPSQMYAWAAKFYYDLYTQRYKAASHAIPGIKVGSFSPQSHDITKFPGDIPPKIWLDELASVPDPAQLDALFGW